MPASRVLPLRPPSHGALPPGREGAPLESRTDDELMTLARAGSREAFGALALRHMGRLVGFCAKQLGDVRAGEEVAQETWIYLWSSRATYVPQDRFIVLLLTAARHRCANYRRGTKRREGPLAPLDDPAALPADPTASQLDALLERERRRRVHAALEDVPPRLRDALLLRFGEDLSYEEMQTVLETRASTLRSRVLYGLRALREALERGKP